MIFLFSLIFSEIICTWLANGILMISLGWWVLNTPYQAIGTSIVESCFFIPLLLFSIYAGKLSDRSQPTTMIKRVTAFKLTVIFILIIYYVLTSINFYLLVLCVFLIASGNSIIDPVMYGYAAKVLNEKDFTRFIAVAPLLTDLSFFLGSLIVALIYPLWGLHGVFIVVAILYSVALFSVSLLPKLNMQNVIRESLIEMKSAEKKHLVSKLPLVLYCSIIFFFGVMMMFVLLYSKNYLQEDIKFVSYFQAAFVLGLFIAMMYVWKYPFQKRLAKKTIVSHLISLLSLLLLFLGHINNYLPLLSFLIIGITEGFNFIILDRVWMLQHSFNTRGKASGQLLATSTLARIVGLYGIGLIVNYISIQSIIIFIGIYLFAIAMLTFMKFRKLDSLKAFDEKYNV